MISKTLGKCRIAWVNDQTKERKLLMVAKFKEIYGAIGFNQLGETLFHYE